MTTDNVRPSVIYGQLRDFLATHERRRRLIPRAVLVGVGAGLLAVAFRELLNQLDSLRTQFMLEAHDLPFGLVIVMGLCVSGCWGGVYLVRRFAPEASGSGIPHVAAVLHRMHQLRWKRILPVKFMGGLLCIGSGMALGREGPTIQIGSAVGQMAADLLGTRPRERRTLIAAGAGAGLAAAFNAPLAGLMFVLEELQRDFATGVFTTTFMAAVAADLVTRYLSGQQPIYAVPNTETPRLAATPVFILLGLICGVLGVAYNRGLLFSLRWFDRLPCRSVGVGGALVGIVVGIVGWTLPQMLGDGHHVIEATLRESSPISWLLGLFLLRYVLTLLCYGCGAPGGIFAPMLVLGAFVGNVVGQATHTFYPTLGGSVQTFAVVAMAAYFTAVVRSPLTGIVLILEMTSNFNLMLSLLLASLTAYGTANALGDLPIYEALLQRQLQAFEEKPQLGDTLLVEMPVLAGAPFEGKAIRELGLPSGCLLIAVRRLGEELVPTSDMKLRAADWIVSVVSPQAADAVALLRQGSGADAQHSMMAQL